VALQNIFKIKTNSNTSYRIKKTFFKCILSSSFNFNKKPFISILSNSCWSTCIVNSWNQLFHSSQQNVEQFTLQKISTKIYSARHTHELKTTCYFHWVFWLGFVTNCVWLFFFSVFLNNFFLQWWEIEVVFVCVNVVELVLLYIGSSYFSVVYDIITKFSLEKLDRSMQHYIYNLILSDSSSILNGKHI
jgi:hypothetical protein